MYITLWERKVFFVKFKKFTFWLGSMSFLAHVLSRNGVFVYLKNIEVVVKWKQLTDVPKICSFFA